MRQVSSGAVDAPGVAEQIQACVQCGRRFVGSDSSHVADSSHVWSAAGKQRRHTVRRERWCAADLRITDTSQMSCCHCPTRTMRTRRHHTEIPCYHWYPNQPLHECSTIRTDLPTSSQKSEPTSRRVPTSEPTIRTRIRTRLWPENLLYGPKTFSTARKPSL